jgi:hypothetical protein
MSSSFKAGTFDVPAAAFGFLAAGKGFESWAGLLCSAGAISSEFADGFVSLVVFGLDALLALVTARRTSSFGAKGSARLVTAALDTDFAVVAFVVFGSGGDS